MLSAVEAAPAARGWAAALVRYEFLLLGELGFGLDLSACVVTGAREICARQPEERRGGKRAAGAPYAARLLRAAGVPARRRRGRWDDILAGLPLTGHFLARDILTERRAAVLAARERLVERLRRVDGLMPRAARGMGCGTKLGG